MSPRRIQRKRTKGWRMPAGAVHVGRGTRWGNPYRVGDESAWMGEQPVHGIEEPLAAKDAADLYRLAVKGGHLPVSVEQVRAELAGKDLACWCPPDAACHADVLLELANPTNNQKDNR